MTKAKTRKPPPVVDEVKVLFPEEQVGPYTLRPWTLDQFFRLTGAIITLLEGLIALGLNESNTEDFMNRPMGELMPALVPIIPEVLAVTLRLTPAEVKEINVGMQAALGMKILLLNKENQEQIKNFLAGFFTEKLRNPAIH
jgi:hypothetical protein